MKDLLEILDNPNTPISEKAAAASELWNHSLTIQNALKGFKKSVKNLARKGEVLHLGNKDYYCTIDYQCASPSLDSVDIEALKEIIPQDIYEKYVSHSYTIRWGAYKKSPAEVKQLFESIPNIKKQDVIQVKFNNKS